VVESVGGHMHGGEDVAADVILQNEVRSEVQKARTK
jgi:hypothetical protein